MPRGRFNVLRRQTRKMVFDVYAFMKKESEQGLQFDLKMVQKRTAAATGVSVSTIKRIIAAAKDPNSAGLGMAPIFRTPGKKRRGVKRITDIDSFDRGVIKRCVHNFHKTEKELPTIKLLLRKLRQDIGFNGSATSLRTILKDLGFKWKKTEDNRKLLIEHTNIRLKRIEYLQKLAQYREEGRPIIYTDESYVDSSHVKPKAWSDGSTQGLKKNISKGQRIVIVHAGSETGFVPNALLMFKAGSKTGDYHNNMNYDNYEKWIRTQLIPNLPANSVVVVDNASYHNKLDDAAPTSSARKAVMETWLRERNIEFSSTMLKPVLYKLICTHKEKHKRYSIDSILRAHGHAVLRLPPYHPDLNPIEMAWAAIKGHVAQKNVTWNVEDIMKLIEEKVNSMGEPEWSRLCIKVRSTEEEYKKNEPVIDQMIEEFIIRLGESESEDNSASETEDSDSDHLMDYSSSSDDEIPSTSSKEPEMYMEGVSAL